MEFKFISSTLQCNVDVIYKVSYIVKAFFGWAFPPDNDTFCNISLKVKTNDNINPPMPPAPHTAFMIRQLIAYLPHDTYLWEYVFP